MDLWNPPLGALVGISDDFITRQASAWTAYLQRFEAHGSESYSGWGSNMEATVPVREWLPKVIAEHDIKTMLDAPCGDWNWMQHVDIGHVNYLGWDVEMSVLELAASLSIDYRTTFQQVNLLTVDTVPTVDLILCRDFFFHLPNEYIASVLDKFKVSGSTYLIATNHPQASNDRDCPLDGGEDGVPGYYCQEVNLEAEPFGLHGRVAAVSEDRDSPQELVLFDLESA